MWNNCISHTLLAGMRKIQPLSKTVWQYLIKLNLHYYYDPEILLVGFYTREIKSYVHTKMYMQVFMAVLLIIVKNWK